MLEPQDRQLLRDALRPPPGYMLDRAVMTTFSLDLIAMLTIPVSFTFFQLKDSDGPPSADPLALLEALRRYASRITVFCQAGQIHVPRQVQLLLGYLEDSIHLVQAPKGGVFHPKVTVLRYRPNPIDGSSEDLPPLAYRVLCSSRNLTFDRSWDTLLVLDGVLAENRKNAFARNHPLARFVRSLPELALHPLSEKAVGEADSMADELLRVDFELPSGFDDLEFLPLGLEGSSDWPILGHRRMLAMAPFVNDGFVQRFADAGTPLGLISRVESLDELSPEHVKQLFDGWYLNTAAEPAPAEVESPVDEQNGPASSAQSGDVVELAPSTQLHGLHAKLFVADDGWDGHIWTGSANATTAAFERNVEFLIRLSGKKSKCGISAFLGIGDDEQSDGAQDRKIGFADLLVKYHREESAQVDSTQKALERMLDDARYALASSRIVGHVSEIPGEGPSTRYRVSLDRPSPEPLNLPASISIQCHPLTLRADSAIPINVPVGQDVAVFEPLSFEAITSFYAFRLTARHEGQELSCGFVVNVPLVGAPSDRPSRILLSLLRNREQLLRYLLMLLADDEDAARQAVEAFSADAQNHHAEGQGGGFGLPLLEPLLQALDRQPDRLDQIARLIDDLRKTPEGRQLVSDQFLSIWEPIWAARKGLTHA